MIRLRRADVIPAVIVCAAIVFVGWSALDPQRVLFFRDHSQAFRRLLFRVVTAYGHGRMPYWDPYAGGGEPLAANPNALVFSPLLAIFALPGGFIFTYDVFVVAQLFVAALSQLALARTVGLSKGAAWCSALLWSLSGFVVSLNCVLATQASAALAPLAIALAVRLAREAGGASHLAGLFAIALGYHVISVDPAFLAADVPLFLAAAWDDIKAKDGFIARVRLCARPLLAAPLAAGLIAVELVLVRDLLHHSVRGAGLSLWHTQWFSLHPVRIFELFLPGISGEPETQAFFSSEDHGQIFIASAYLGASALPWAMLGLKERRSRRFLALAAFFLLMALGRYTPLHGFLARVVPGLAQGRFPEKLLYGVAMSFSLAVGFAVDHAIADRARAAAFLRRAVLPSLLGFALLVVLVFVAFPSSVAPYLGPYATIDDALPYFSRAVVQAILAALLGLGLLGRLVSRGEEGGATLWGLMLLLAVDLGLAARPAMPVADRRIYDEPEIGRIVRRDDPDAGVLVYEATAVPNDPPSRSRVTAYALRRLAPGLGEALGFRYFLDPDLSSLRSEDWRELSGSFASWTEPERYRALGRLGTTHLLIESDRTDIPGLRFVGRAEIPDGPPLDAFRIEGGRSLLSIAHRLEPEPSDMKDAFAVLAAAPAGDLVLADKEAARRIGPTLGRGRTEIAEHRMEEGRITATVTSTVPSVLIAAQHFREGWRARVNGRAVEPIRVEVMLVGVPLEAGTSKVELEYVPPHVRLGFAISGASLVAIASMIAIGLLRALRPRPADGERIKSR